MQVSLNELLQVSLNGLLLNGPSKYPYRVDVYKIEYVDDTCSEYYFEINLFKTKSEALDFADHAKEHCIYIDAYDRRNGKALQ